MSFQFINIDQALEYYENDSDLLNSVVALYLEKMDGMVSSIKEAIDVSDCKLASERAHQLKGATSNVFIEKVYILAKGLEVAGKSDDLKECQKLFSDLEAIVGPVKMDLGNMLKHSKAS